MARPPPSPILPEYCELEPMTVRGRSNGLLSLGAMHYYYPIQHLVFMQCVARSSDTFVICLLVPGRSSSSFPPQCHMTGVPIDRSSSSHPGDYRALHGLTTTPHMSGQCFNLGPIYARTRPYVSMILSKFIIYHHFSLHRACSAYFASNV